MKKILLATLFSLLFGFSVHAQNTNVSATVTDAGGQTWNNGTYTFNFIPKPQFNGTYRLSGSPYTPVPVTGSLSSVGAFTNVPVPDNNLITPSGTQWTVTVCAQTNFICFTSGFITITGASQTITSSVIPPAISVTCGLGAVAYADSEVGCSIGGQYYNLINLGNRQCIAVTGNVCTTWTAAGGAAATIGIKGVNIFSPLDYGAKFDTQYAFGVSCTNGSTLITSAGSDPPFKSSDVGKAIAGNAAGLNGVANCPPQGTITSFVDAHNVNVSVAPVNPSPSTNSQTAWGTNDGAAIAASFAASIGKGCLILPAGNALFDVPPFLNTAAVTGEPVCVIGQHTTNLTPLPSFNVSNCYVTQTACFYYSNNALQTEPNFSILRDFEFFGMGWNLTGNFTNYTLVNSNRVTSMNFWIWNLGTSPDSAIRFQGPNYYYSFTAYNTGGITACSVIGVGGTSAGLNQMTTMEQSYCKGGQHSVTVGTNASIRSFGGQFDSPGGGRIAQAETITNDGIFDSYGEGSFLGASGKSSISTTANGTTYLRGTWVVGQSANTDGAVGCAASGGKVILEASNIDGGGGGGFTLKNVAGCTIIDKGGNTYLNGPSMSLAGPFIADGHSLKGSCTGVATASQTLGLYGTGPNVTATTCTSTNIGTGLPLQGTRTAQALTVTATAAGTNASSGVVTVLKNGVATTITCTIGTATSCSDGTHSTAFADGDLISIQFTTQAADTLAGVKAFVEWN